MILYVSPLPSAFLRERQKLKGVTFPICGKIQYSGFETGRICNLSCLEVPRQARVLDNGQRLVLLASGQDVSEAELKLTAAALGRGYVLSQVKIVENDAWKFNASGKLLRNVVPLDVESLEAPKLYPSDPG